MLIMCGGVSCVTGSMSAPGRRDGEPAAVRRPVAAVARGASMTGAAGAATADTAGTGQRDEEEGGETEDAENDDRGKVDSEYDDQMKEDPEKERQVAKGAVATTTTSDYSGGSAEHSSKGAGDLKPVDQARAHAATTRAQAYNGVARRGAALLGLAAASVSEEAQVAVEARDLRDRDTCGGSRLGLPGDQSFVGGDWSANLIVKALDTLFGGPPKC